MDKRTLRTKKGRPRNARQYDRPNQGIFGKVYSTMKGILQPTSWIFNSVSNWIGNNSEERQPAVCSDIEEDTVREDNDIVSQSVSHGNKRLRLRFDDNIPSIQSSGTQTWPEQPPQNLYDNVSHVQSSTTQSSLLENKESITVLNGDDHSENSEGSASTSGCSSLVSSHKDSNKLVESPFHSLRSGLKNNRKRKEPSKSELDDLNSSRTLWSSGFGVTSKYQRRLPTISHTNQPSFNLSTFVGPSKLNESLEKKITSPFYDGRTTFGGASASRRMPSSVAPYQVDKTLRNQIKVREHNADDNLEGMSSAAKRILLTLEKMSTPVADAKKIPNTKTSPVDLSVYLTPPKSRRNSQFTPTISSKGPPIANINTIAKLATLKNYGVSRLRNTLQGSPLTSVGQESYNFDNKVSTSYVDVVFKSGGGKMKNKLNQHHQSSKDVNGENKVLADPDLPSIPLPISKLPTINFGAKVEKPVESNQSAKGFTFSNPIEHDLSNTVSTSSFALPSSFDSKTEKNSDLQPKSFVFSSPIEHELPNISVLPKENAALPVISTVGSGASSQSTWECSGCWVRNSNSRNSCIACETSRNPKENSPVSVKVTAGNPVVSTLVSIPSTSAFTVSQSSSLPVLTFGKSKASEDITPSSFSFGSSDSKAAVWECSACWVKNSDKDSKCIACETVRVKKDNMNTKAVDSSSVSSSSATWECNACWVKNSVKESKCCACESPRSPKESSQGFNSVGNTSDEWECDSCWVKNPVKESKCKACETVRPSKVKADVKSADSNVFSTWECTSCWVRNAMKEKKCKACETLHPSADKSSGFKDTNGFKFSSPIQNSPITFKFGNYVCTAPSTVTTSTFKFGIAASEPQTAASTTGFNFGAPSKTSTSSFFSTPTIAEGIKNGQGIANENSSIKTGLEKVNEGSTKLDAVNESNTKISKVSENEGFLAETSETTPVLSGVNFETTNPLLVSKSAENKVSISVITSTSSETLVSKAKEVTAPSVTACFSFTTQPLLDSKKPETFPFGAPKEKLSSHSLSSPFTGFSASSKDKLPADEKALQSEIKNVDVASENKLLSVFQPVSQSQQVSSAFTVLTNAPVFKFGEKTDSSKINLSTTTVTATTTSPTSFCFTNSMSNYGTVTDSKVSETGSAASETVPPPPSVKADDVKISSSVPISSAATTSSFVFGNTVSSTPSAFSFFPPSSTSTAVSSVFTFGASSNTAQTSNSGGFTFKGLDTPKNVTSISSVTPVSSTSQSTSAVNIGTSVPGGGFVFGTPKTEAQSTAAVPFAFGSGAVTPNMSAFSAFQPSQSTNTAFQFGSQPTGSTSSTIGTSNNFAFAKSEMSNQVPSSVSQNPVSAFGSSTSNFVFGAKSETANQIPSSTGAQAPGLAFGSSTSSFSFSNKAENTSTVSQNPNPTFGSSMPSVFGNTSVTPFGGTEKPASGGFNFGGVSTTSGVFQFGATNNTERKRPAAGPGFSFGTPPASEPTSSFPQNFNMNTPPSFNFGATSTPTGPGPFQFAASSATKTAATQNAPRKYRKALRRVRKD